MNSRVSWSAEGIDPAVRERAEAAARRAGMSLNDWLNSTIGASAAPDFRVPQDQPRTPLPSQDAKDVADIHQRLDSITRQIEQISKPAPRSDAPRNEPGVAKQLNDAISRLDARLSQISDPAPVRQAQRQDTLRQTEKVERAAAQVYRPSPPLNPGSLDFAIAEITARQSELDNSAPKPMPPRSAPPIAPAMTPPAPSGPDFSGLEKHLLKITSQIEALQRPDNIEQSIAAFRGELNEIRHAITEAMPRRAIESIENEIRSLSRRIDDSRQSGIDDQVLANIERALNEIREALRSMTPAEQLAGYDEAIRNLSAKLDMIVRSSDDPGTMRQLEDAIAALRSIVSNVASTDALTRLSEDVHTLSAKVDQFARAEGRGDSFAVLEQRIAALTSSLESRERPVVSDNSEHIDGALRALMDRLDHLQVGNDSASAFAHLEQRVSYLLERLEASSDHRSGNLGRVEEGLQDVLRHLETQHAHFAALADNSRSVAAPAAMQVDSGLVDLIKRELSDMQFRQSETGRQTQDALEVVHNTLGHVVDRLAMIEGDLRAVRSAPVPPPAPVPAAQPIPAPRAAMPQQPVSPPLRPELPNPVAAQPHFAAAPREFHAAETPAAPAIATPRAISEILEPRPAPLPRAAIEPDLPPDHPLEPGTRPLGRAASPSERIAASENAISEISPGTREQASTSSFIAAARRAAQAAAAQPAKDSKAKRAAPLKDPAGDSAKGSSTITSKIRSLLVGASVVVIVLGTFKMAMTLLDSGTPPSMPESEITSEPPPAALPPAESAKPAAPAPAMPSMTSPTPIGRQSLNAPAPITDSTASVVIPQAAAPVTAPITAADITGTIPQASPAIPVLPANRKLTLIQIPPEEKLPDGIGGPALRTAALKGDPSAAYEIGVRYAEGKGVPASYDDAAKWYDRAAQAGLVPAIFRLGTLYEKGLSVKKDIDIARRYYLQAAERGNAKAMHNLAVLDADGGGKGANYKSASLWFRKAADRGVADSQFNLGILYARGIGVEQNLAESFKWFSLAAAQGDTDSVRKRDDIAKRLDAQSLAAAKLAIQTFTPEGQPDDAVNATSPAGGWDAAPTQASMAKPAPAAAKPASTKRATR
ncbi:MAG: localization factor PodJL [Bradyrhizobium sp.]|nr:localization factor PodJL [Bradyrhizobium sp.]